MRTMLVVLLTAALAACTIRSPAPEDDESVPDAGDDTGGGGDIGDDDAGPSVEPDAGDAGAPSDGGSTADAGTPDAGETDGDADDYTITCTVIAGATWVELQANFFGGWETIARADGRTLSWTGHLDEHTLAQPACTMDAVGQDCGYVFNPHFDVYPFFGVTQDGGGHFRGASVCSISGPRAVDLRFVDNGDHGGNYALVLEE